MSPGESNSVSRIERVTIIGKECGFDYNNFWFNRFGRCNDENSRCGIG